MRLWLKIALGLVTLLLLVPVALLLAVQTGPGKSALASLAERFASSEAMVISIGRIEGTVPSNMRIDRISLADAQGEWLLLEDLHLAWHPLALLRRQVAVDQLAAGQIILRRPPLAAPDAPEPESEPFAWPPKLSLPVRVDVDALRVDRLVYEPALDGQGIAAVLDGTASLGARADPWHVGITSQRLDAGGGGVEVRAAFLPQAPNNLTLDIAFNEAADGALAGLLGLPGKPALRLSLNGDGPLDNWQGQAQAVAEGLADLDVRVQSSGAADGQAVSLSAMATGTLSPELGGPAGPLLATWRSADLSALIGFDGSIGEGRLTVAADALDLTATGSLSEDASAIALRLEAFDHPAWREVAPGPVWRTALVEAVLKDALQQPEGTLSVTIDDLAAADGEAFAFAQAVLNARFSGEQPLTEPDAALTIDLTGQVQGLALSQAQAGDLIGPSPSLAASGHVGLNGTLELASLTLEAGAVEASAQGAFTDWGQNGHAQASVGLADISPIGPGLGGRLDVTAEAAVEAGRLVLDAAAAGAGLSVVDERITQLIGPAPRLTARLTAEGADLALERVNLQAAHLTFGGDGVVSDGFLAAGGRLEVDDLSLLAAPLTGAVTADILASGSLADPAVNLTLTGEGLSAAGRQITGPRLTADFSSLLSAPAGQVNLEAGIDGLPLRADAALEAPAPGDWAVSDLLVTLGQLRIEGQATGSGPLAAGGVTLRSDDLSDLSPLAGVPLAGRLDGDVSFSAPEQAQEITAILAIDGLRAADAAIGQIRADLNLANLPEGEISGDIAVTAISAGPLQAGKASIGLLGNISALQAALSVSGDLSGKPLQADARTSFSTEPEGLVIGAESLNVAWAGIPLTLRQPVTVRPLGGGAEIDGLILGLADGTLRADGTIGDTHDFRAALEAIPVALAGAFMEGPPPGGQLDGTITLGGSRENPDGRVALTGSQLSVSPSLEPLELTVTADLSADRVSAELSLTSGETVRLDGQGSLGLNPPAGGLFPTPRADAAVDASLFGRFDLAYAAALAPPELNRLEGIIELDTSVSGTLSAPRTAGSARLTGGAVEQRELGLSLESLTANVAFEPERIVLEELRGRFFQSGELTASGAVDLTQAPNWPVRGELAISPSRILDGDLATVDVQSALTLSGVLNQAARLEGRLQIDRAEFRIPDTLPPSVVELPVRERNEVEAQAGQEPEERAANPLLASLALDIDVDAPSQVFVRGRGLDVELGGAFVVTGTAADPEVDGALGLRRGRLAALSQTLTFQRAEIDFDGADLGDPNLDFLAGTQVDDTLAQIAVTGTASAPEFAFVSDPPLPEDEVASLILFGSPSSELSPFQAVQLATRVGELTGVVTGPSLTDQVRDSLGLDELTVSGGATGPSLSAGRYVADNIFVGVDQGLGAGGDSSVSVEVELTDHITVESDVGARSAGQVGINFRWDY